jgi:hypothetical protein
MIVSLEAAGVLMLGSCWFKRIQEAASAKKPKATSGRMNRFPKAAVVDNFPGFIYIYINPVQFAAAETLSEQHKRLTGKSARISALL